MVVMTEVQKVATMAVTLVDLKGSCSVDSSVDAKAFVTADQSVETMESEKAVEMAVLMAGD